MKDDLIPILFFLSVFTGLPMLILWLRDRGGFLRSAMSTLLGLTALLFGLALIVWLVSETVHPTTDFEDSLFVVVQLLFLFVMMYVGWKWLTDKGPGIEEIPIGLAPGKAEESVAKARATLPWFEDQVRNGTKGAYIRFALTSPSGSVEHKWAPVDSYHDGCFAVSPSGDPVHEGEEYFAVPLDEVEDWQVIYPDGRIKGAYSRIALFAHYEVEGNTLSRKMRKQKAQLIDAEQGEDV